jgi:hypothetical protein
MPSSENDPGEATSGAKGNAVLSDIRELQVPHLGGVAIILY